MALEALVVLGVLLPQCQGPPGNRRCLVTSESTVPLWIRGLEGNATAHSPSQVRLTFSPLGPMSPGVPGKPCGPMSP